MPRHRIFDTELRQHLPALRGKGGAQAPQQGRGRPGHLLAHRLRRRGARPGFASDASLETFFAQAPELNPNASLITGTICGHRVQEIDDPLMQKIRYMDLLVDEVARGKKMTSILRGSTADA